MWRAREWGVAGLGEALVVAPTPRRTPRTAHLEAGRAGPGRAGPGRYSGCALTLYGGGGAHEAGLRWAALDVRDALGAGYSMTHGRRLSPYHPSYPNYPHIQHGWRLSPCLFVVLLAGPHQARRPRPRPRNGGLVRAGAGGAGCGGGRYFIGMTVKETTLSRGRVVSLMVLGPARQVLHRHYRHPHALHPGAAPPPSSIPAP